MLLAGAAVLAGCAAGGATVDRNTGGDAAGRLARPVKLVAGADLHLIAAWTPDVLLAGQAAARPGEKQSWDALYRLPARGGPLELLARDVYGVRFLRPPAPGPGGRAAGPAPVLAYLVPDGPGVQTLHSTGRLFLCRPGTPPRPVRPADVPLALQVPVFSPDGAYVLSYGAHPDRLRFSIDVTEVATGRSRRLGAALSVAVPRWFGFAGSGPRYVELPGIDDVRFTAYRLDGPPQAGVVLPGRMGGLLPDGRAVLEGGDLLAAVLATGGAITTLAAGPMLDYSVFVHGGLPYFIRRHGGPGGHRGALLRLGPDGREQPVMPVASWLWSVSPDGPIAYVSDKEPGDGNDNDLIALDLSSLGTTLVSGDRVHSRRPLPGGGLLLHKDGDGAGLSRTWVWLPGQAAATPLADHSAQTIAVARRRFAVVDQGDRTETDRTDRASGTLRLVSATGQPASPVLATGVEFIDSLEGEPDGATLVYSILAPGLAPAGAPGIWRQALP